MCIAYDVCRSADLSLFCILDVFPLYYVLLYSIVQNKRNKNNSRIKTNHIFSAFYKEPVLNIYITKYFFFCANSSKIVLKKYLTNILIHTGEKIIFRINIYLLIITFHLLHTCLIYFLQNKKNNIYFSLIFIDSQISFFSQNIQNTFSPSKKIIYNPKLTHNIHNTLHYLLFVSF